MSPRLLYTGNYKFLKMCPYSCKTLFIIYLQGGNNGKFNMKSRHVFAIMFFLANFNHYILRNNINVAIVAMVNSTAREVVLFDNTSEVQSSTECPKRGSSNISTIENVNAIYVLFKMLKETASFSLL